MGGQPIKQRRANILKIVSRSTLGNISKNTNAFLDDNRSNQKVGKKKSDAEQSRILKEIFDGKKTKASLTLKIDAWIDENIHFLWIPPDVMKDTEWRELEAMKASQDDDPSSASKKSKRVTDKSSSLRSLRSSRSSKNRDDKSIKSGSVKSDDDKRNEIVMKQMDHDTSLSKSKSGYKVPRGEDCSRCNQSGLTGYKRPKYVTIDDDKLFNCKSCGRWTVETPGNPDMECPKLAPYPYCFSFFTYFYSNEVDENLMPFRRHIASQAGKNIDDRDNQAVFKNILKDAFLDRRILSIERKSATRIFICKLKKKSFIKGLPRRRIIILSSNVDQLMKALSLMEDSLPEVMEGALFHRPFPVTTSRRWVTPKGVCVRKYNTPMSRKRRKTGTERLWEKRVLPHRTVPPSFDGNANQTSQSNFTLYNSMSKQHVKSKLFSHFGNQLSENASNYPSHDADHDDYQEVKAEKDCNSTTVFNNVKLFSDTSEKERNSFIEGMSTMEPMLNKKIDESDGISKQNYGYLINNKAKIRVNDPEMLPFSENENHSEKSAEHNPDLIYLPANEDHPSSNPIRPSHDGFDRRYLYPKSTSNQIVRGSKKLSACESKSFLHRKRLKFPESHLTHLLFRLNENGQPTSICLRNLLQQFNCMVENIQKSEEDNQVPYVKVHFKYNRFSDLKAICEMIGYHF